MSESSSAARSYWHRARRCARLAEWVPPVGGALSRHTNTWEVHAAGVHRRGRVPPRSKQPRRCQAAQAAEEMPGRQAGAHRRCEDSPLARSTDLAEFTSDFLLELELCRLMKQVAAGLHNSIADQERAQPTAALLSERHEANAGLNKLAKRIARRPHSRVLSLPISGR